MRNFECEHYSGCLGKAARLEEKLECKGCTEKTKAEVGKIGRCEVGKGKEEISTAQLPNRLSSELHQREGNMGDKKACKKCGVEYPLTEEYFSKCGNDKQYWEGRCKGCRTKDGSRAYRQKVTGNVKREYIRRASPPSPPPACAGASAGRPAGAEAPAALARMRGESAGRLEETGKDDYDLQQAIDTLADAWGKKAARRIIDLIKKEFGL